MTRIQKTNPRRAFTLIEMLVVVVIIVLLMGAVVAVGSMVRSNANRRATLTQLKTLSEMMKDYLDKGNPEPSAPAPSTGNNWIWGELSDANYRVPPLYYKTAPASDPINWITAFKSVPEISKKLDNMPTTTDSTVPSMLNPAVVHTLVIDSYGNHIRYVPSSANTQGYFISAGPDGKWSTMVTNNLGSTTTDGKDHSINSAPVLRTDELLSTDPQ